MEEGSRLCRVQWSCCVCTEDSQMWGDWNTPVGEADDLPLKVAVGAFHRDYCVDVGWLCVTHLSLPQHCHRHGNGKCCPAKHFEGPRNVYLPAFLAHHAANLSGLFRKFWWQTPS